MMILKWCYGTTITKEDIIKKIKDAESVNDLVSLYKNSPDFQVELYNEFVERRKELEAPLNQIVSNKFSSNGTNH
jgi:hypothetical protein